MEKISRLLRELEAGGCTVRCLAHQPVRVADGRATWSKCR
jgi:hypothetical protein